jgi:electron transfer flavoprotein beta subunit
VEQVVLIKQVPDTATRIQDRVRNGSLDLANVTWVANPYDEYAVEEALRIKERMGGSVTLLALGPERVQSALKDMLALGADEAVQLWDPSFEFTGPLGTATILAAALAKLPFDLIWGGWKGVDDDSGAVPVYLAARLGLPHINFVTGLEVADGTVTATREVEGGHERLVASLPAVITAQKGLNEVRYASLKGIMSVKSKVIPVWDATTLGLDPSAIPAPGVVRRNLEPPPARAGGRKLDGSPDEAARELVRLLREEAKVI